MSELDQIAETTAQETTQDAVEQVGDITAESITTTNVTEEDVTQRIITTPNPTPEEMEAILANIKVNYNSLVDTKPVQFNFKKSVDKLTSIETLRNAVQLAMPYPSVEGIVDILKGGGKQLELLQEAIEKIVNDAARELLAEDVTLTAGTFPVDKISWDAISQQPKAQRRGGGIPKETWEAFIEDYIDIMPAVTGKNLEQVGNAAKIFMGKLAQVKTNMTVLPVLVDQLAIYVDNSPNAEEYQDCVAFLLTKAEAYLNITDEELLANL